MSIGLHHSEGIIYAFGYFCLYGPNISVLRTLGGGGLTQVLKGLTHNRVSLEASLIAKSAVQLYVFGYFCLYRPNISLLRTLWRGRPS